MKACKSCKQEKPADATSFRVDRRIKCGLTARCRACIRNRDHEMYPVRKTQINESRKIRNKDGKYTAQNRVWRANNREHVRETKRTWYAANLELHMLVNAKKRAEQAGVPFDLRITDIRIPEYCPILGLKLERATGTAAPNSPSLDRIIPDIGYVRGNVHVISHRANSIKNNASTDELFAIARYLTALFEKNRSVA